MDTYQPHALAPALAPPQSKHAQSHYGPLTQPLAIWSLSTGSLHKSGLNRQGFSLGYNASISNTRSAGIFPRFCHLYTAFLVIPKRLANWIILISLQISGGVCKTRLQKQKANCVHLWFTLSTTHEQKPCK